MTKVSDLKCRICGRHSGEIGGYLERINKGEVPSIWECRPRCDADLPNETAILMAIEGEDNHDH